jgi:transcriptional regulator
MYLPALFNETRTDVLHALMRARPLASLVAQCESGLIANHVPVQTLAAPGPLGSLRGHIARANSLWKEYRDGSEAIAIFQGPQVYISPSLYPTKKQTGEVVPTWDYAVVHARGSIRFIHDADWLRSFVAGLTDAHEASRPEPWKIGDAPPEYIESMMGLIVGFELTITSLTGKWKVSQNRSAEDQQGVVQGLRDADDEDSHEIAAMLASRGP